MLLASITFFAGLALLFAALSPGVTYTFWLAGHDSEGDGPISNKVTFTA